MTVKLDAKQKETYHSCDRRGRSWVEFHMSCSRCDSYNCMWSFGILVRKRFYKEEKQIGWKLVQGKWVCPDCLKRKSH